MQLEKSEGERQEVNRYAQELLHKVKKDSEALEFMIDRRMITQFLVNYVNSASPPAVKNQMLETMSRILAFSMEDK